ncbi:hypothetical protein NIES21_15420 [Anabaenopsis circularis NIES-21]|uniref:Uncharacterized protein n=1 Tax=Anabaenopsis circularis NIES-21 TaxID=1085406 RepID=A0A1Z4GDW9_9CYAN|nr:hypothetical protein NIES21_15420 [Anabaenopsis circularis NIES-21]
MFGIDFEGSDEIEGLQAILKRIASNDESGKLTHKEIRAYARCMLPIVSYITGNREIQLLMAALSASGLPHYDRSFIASKILKLLEEIIKLKKEQSSNPNNF